MEPNTIVKSLVQTADDSISVSDFTKLLQSFGLEHVQKDFYLHVGEIHRTQGWILHLSVVLSQIEELLNLIIPFLSHLVIPFKIPLNEKVGESLLNGSLGIDKIGKIISIYTEDDNSVLKTAKALFELTRQFRGPAILTDFCLGNIVYTRYGSFNPVIKLDGIGNEDRYIYDAEGNLVRDNCPIPFQFPEKTEWPFTSMAQPVMPGPPQLLNRTYRLLDILKQDPRGNVFKGLYLKGLFQVKHCVLKQGFSNSLSDKFGRDIQDRLIWQETLYKELKDIVPMPAVYDLFQEQGFTLLVIEYKKAVSLYKKIQDINELSKSWQLLSLNDKLRFTDYAIKITEIVRRIHLTGYVHRDIVPVNFLCDKKDRLFLIDLELAYSLKDHKPDPPFILGTSGFMSPEQQAMQRPTRMQDIYSLAATILYIFTGLTPIKFDPKDRTYLFENLTFFIGNDGVASVIADCWQEEPHKRPDIDTILFVLREFRNNLVASPGLNGAHQNRPAIAQYRIEKLLGEAIAGLGSSIIASANGVWCSKQTSIGNNISQVAKKYAIYPGITEGISGPLRLLAKLKMAGIDIGPCSERIANAYNQIEKRFSKRLSEMYAGLNRGAAGMALALADGIRSGLIHDSPENRQRIHECLSLPDEDLDIAYGISGQGVALLQCRDLLTSEICGKLLGNVIDRLANAQQKDDSWIKVDANSDTGYTMDLAYDDTGIIWFLLEYSRLFTDSTTRELALKALIRLIHNKKTMTYFYDLVATRKSYEYGDGGTGLIAMLIKAYETLHEPHFRVLAEKGLCKYPPQIVNGNFSQKNGLSAIGEVFLEAWRVFHNEKWRERALSIAEVLLHTSYREKDGSCYWIMEENDAPTADFIIGNSGIIHFVARCLIPDKLGYRMLN